MSVYNHFYREYTLDGKCLICEQLPHDYVCDEDSFKRVNRALIQFEVQGSILKSKRNDLIEKHKPINKKTTHALCYELDLS